MNLVRDPTKWTILQHDGPDNLGLWYNALPERQMALIASGCVPSQHGFAHLPARFGFSANKDASATTHQVLRKETLVAVPAPLESPGSASMPAALLTDSDGVGWDFHHHAEGAGGHCIGEDVVCPPGTQSQDTSSCKTARVVC